MLVIMSLGSSEQGHSLYQSWSFFRWFKKCHHKKLPGRWGGGAESPVCVPLCYPPSLNTECQSPWKVTPPSAKDSALPELSCQTFGRGASLCGRGSSLAGRNFRKLPQGQTGFQKELASFTGANYILAAFLNGKLSTCKWSNHLSPPFQTKKGEMEGGWADLHL